MNFNSLRSFCPASGGRLAFTAPTRHFTALKPLRSYSTNSMHPFGSPPSPLLRAVMRGHRPHPTPSGIVSPVSLQRASLHSSISLNDSTNNERSSRLATTTAPTNTTSGIKASAASKANTTPTPPEEQTPPENAPWKQRWKHAPRIIKIYIGVQAFLILVLGPHTGHAWFSDREPESDVGHYSSVVGRFMRENFMVTLDNVKQGRWWTLVTNTLGYHVFLFWPLQARWLLSFGPPTIALLGSSARFTVFWITTSTLAAVGGLLCQSYLDDVVGYEKCKTGGRYFGCTAPVCAMVGFLAVMVPRGFKLWHEGRAVWRLCELIVWEIMVFGTYRRSKVDLSLNHYIHLCAAGAGMLWALIAIRRNPSARKQAQQILDRARSTSCA